MKKLESLMPLRLPLSTRKYQKVGKNKIRDILKNLKKYKTSKNFYCPLCKDLMNLDNLHRHSLTNLNENKEVSSSTNNSNITDTEELRTNIKSEKNLFNTNDAETQKFYQNEEMRSEIENQYLTGKIEFENNFDEKSDGFFHCPYCSKTWEHEKAFQDHVLNHKNSAIYFKDILFNTRKKYLKNLNILTKAKRKTIIFKKQLEMLGDSIAFANSSIDRLGPDKLNLNLNKNFDNIENDNVEQIAINEQENKVLINNKKKRKNVKSKKDKLDENLLETIPQEFLCIELLQDNTAMTNGLVKNLNESQPEIKLEKVQRVCSLEQLNDKTEDKPKMESKEIQKLFQLHNKEMKKTKKKMNNRTYNKNNTEIINDLKTIESKNMNSKEEVENVFQCAFCDKVLCNNAHLNIHTRIHTGEKPYKCLYCLASFSIKSTLNAHEKRHRGEKCHSCSECNERFITSSEKKRHERIWHKREERIFKKATHTIKTYEEKKNLNPKALLGEDGLYHCKFCDKTYQDSKIMRKHTTMHINGKKCPKCFKVFPYESALQRHLKVPHTEEPKSFLCSYCGNTYKSRPSLQIHIRIHINPSSCALCEKRFTTECKLIHHMKIKHKVK